MQQPTKCLRELHYKSLLTYGTHAQRYRFHQLIKEFFVYVSNKYEESKLLNKTFVSHFADYFASSGGSCVDVDETRKLYDSIDAERPNLDFLISHSLESCPSYAEPVMESLTGLVFNLTNGALDILHLCKSLHLLFQRLQNMHSWLDTTTRNTKTLQNILQSLDQQDRLQHLVQTLLKLIDVRLYIHEFTKLTDNIISNITKALTRSTKKLQNILQGLSEKHPL